MAGKTAFLTLGTILLMCTTGSSLFAQERPFAFVLKANLTTSSQIFPNPNSPDPVARSESYGLTDFFGYGLEFKYRPPGTSIAVGVSADYINVLQSRTMSIAYRQSVSAEDGYTVIPVEITGYFIIPASGPDFIIYMGGGAGTYFGSRVYRLAGTEAATVSNTPGFGIHVLGGASYRFFDRFSIVAEMKFRDLQFSSTNAFRTSQIRFGNAVVNVDPTPFDANIHTDGIVFQLGASIAF